MLVFIELSPALLQRFTQWVESNYSAMNSPDLDRVFRLLYVHFSARFSIFVEKHNWDTASRESYLDKRLELDQFDSKNPTIAIWYDEQRDQDLRRPEIATLRMLETTGPHMLQNVDAFQSLRRIPYIQKNRYESTRFSNTTKDLRAVPSLLIGVNLWGISKECNDFVTVCGTSMTKRTDNIGYMTPRDIGTTARIGKINTSVYQYQLSSSVIRGIELKTRIPLKNPQLRVEYWKPSGTTVVNDPSIEKIRQELIQASKV